jgi:hypothetical protein
LTARAPEQLEKVVDPGMFTSEELVLLQREFSIATKGSSNGALNFEAFSDVMAKLKLGHLPLDRIFQIFDQVGSICFACQVAGWFKRRRRRRWPVRVCPDARRVRWVACRTGGARWTTRNSCWACPSSDSRARTRSNVRMYVTARRHLDTRHTQPSNTHVLAAA